MDRQPDHDRDDREEGDQPSDAGDERRDEHSLRRMAHPPAREAGLLFAVRALVCHFSGPQLERR